MKLVLTDRTVLSEGRDFGGLSLLTAGWQCSSVRGRLLSLAAALFCF